MSHYAHYEGQCAGRLLHFLSEYCRRDYDMVTFEGGGLISLRGAKFATYTWDAPMDGGRSDIPTFVFEKPIFNESQEHYKPILLSQEIKRKAWADEMKERCKA